MGTVSNNVATTVATSMADVVGEGLVALVDVGMESATVAADAATTSAADVVVTTVAAPWGRRVAVTVVAVAAVGYAGLRVWRWMTSPEEVTPAGGATPQP